VSFEDCVVEAAAVPVVGQLAPELVDEQAAVREDQDALGAGGLDEARGGDRLARGGRVTEAVAADRTWVLRDRQRLRLDLLVLELRYELLLLELFVLLGGRLVTVAVPVLGSLLRRGDQLGEHAGERVDLVAAELRAGGEVRRFLRQDALEAEEERVAHLPGRGRLLQLGVDLGEGVVERPASCGTRCENDLWVVLGT
jgi:hypothetical protein